MSLDDYRAKIDEIDNEIIKKIDERMRVAEKIAEYKKAEGRRIVDPVREQELLQSVIERSEDDMAYYNKMLFSSIMEMSADHQRKVTGLESHLVNRINQALEETPKVFPESATVACQGVAGAYSQEAVEKFFKMPRIMFMKNFRGVFAAIDSGLCKYGVLPIENSTAGSVNQVYDLMAEYDVHIVKSIKIKVDHCLLVNKGVAKKDIKEIYSHEQALAQCEDYLKREFPDANIIVSENTAVAAKTVADSGRKDIAAIASRANGDNYALDCLEESIQDRDNNYTRFICITKGLEIYPGANKTSFMCVTDHKPGALYRLLSLFNAMGINILKLESRPIPNTDFEFMFYFDIEEPVYSEQFIRMMSQLDDVCKEFNYFGSYLEV